MITLIEALGFRCLRHVRQPLGPFQVLAGPNASGKTTFLDVVALLGRLVSDGPDAAVRERAPAFRDLVWRRGEGGFELAVEARIPEERRRGEYEHVRYEVALGPEPDSDGVAILSERVLVKAFQPVSQPPLFASEEGPTTTILTSRALRGVRTVINKVHGGNDNFYAETGSGWDHAFKLGPHKSALGSLPEDEATFPAATWLKRLLTSGVRCWAPDPRLLEGAVHSLEQHDPAVLARWIAELRDALPDLECIRTAARPGNAGRCLVIGYRSGVEIPSPAASGGTLRLLAFTLAAHLPGFAGVYLVEEPAAGLDPSAAACLARALSSIGTAQVLAATQSPAFLDNVAAGHILRFSKDPEGATVIATA